MIVLIVDLIGDKTINTMYKNLFFYIFIYIAMSKEDKDKVIRQVYYDADTGFGSIAETYKESKKILNTIIKIMQIKSH